MEKSKTLMQEQIKRRIISPLRGAMNKALDDIDTELGSCCSSFNDDKQVETNSANATVSSGGDKIDLGYTEACPFDIIHDFLEALMQKRYGEAKRLCDTILGFEPENKLAQDFQETLSEILGEDDISNQPGAGDVGTQSEQVLASSSSNFTSLIPPTAGGDQPPKKVLSSGMGLFRKAVDNLKRIFDASASDPDSSEEESDDDDEDSGESGESNSEEDSGCDDSESDQEEEESDSESGEESSENSEDEYDSDNSECEDTNDPLSISEEEGSDYYTGTCESKSGDCSDTSKRMETPSSP